MTARTRVLVLGGTHLGRGPEPEPEPQSAVQPIVDRVVGWRPDALAVEVLPGHVVAACRALGGELGLLQVGGFPFAVACAEAVEGMHSWDVWQGRAVGSDTSQPLSNRVVAWCAAYEPLTALLLCAGRPQDVPGVPRPLVRALHEGRAAVASEAWRVAGAAALQLGHQRLYPFDDHGNSADLTDVDPDCHQQMMLAAQPIALQRLEAAGLDRALQRALDAGDLWSHWRELNQPRSVAESDELESGLWLEQLGHDVLARRQLAGWRVRNLLMAAHLRQVAGRHPGGRVLALVGHAHKGPLEAALRHDQWDLELVDVHEID